MNNNKGFTMMEIVIVLTLIAILSAVAIPGLKKWQDNSRVTTSATSIRAALQSAKGAAIKNQTTVIVNFTMGTGSAGGYIAFFDDDGDLAYDNGETIVRSGTISQNVTLYAPDTNSFPDDSTQINSMGLPMGISGGTPTNFSGSICVRNSANTIFKRVTLANTGNIKIDRSSAGPNGPWVQ